MFPFIKKRWLFFSISLVLLLTGIAFTLFSGIKLDIQFKGGSILIYSHDSAIDLPQAEAVIQEAIGLSVSCQQSTSLGSDDISLVVSVAGNQSLPLEDQITLQEALAKAFPDQTFKQQQASLVDPFIGREQLLKGIMAVLVASVLIVLYVWLRFRSMSGPSAGVVALITLFHDVALSFFVFVVLGLTVNETLIAVVLSILGYSINDTIVIYDRIRENRRIYKNKMSLGDLIDLSLNQSFIRTLNTSITTISAMVVVYLFAYYHNIEAIKAFALPMIVGLVAGTYSSLTLAAPLWHLWKTRGGRSGY